MKKTKIVLAVVSCVIVAGLFMRAYSWNLYAEPTVPFEFRYPKAYEVQTHFDYYGLPADKTLYPAVSVVGDGERIFSVTAYPASGNVASSTTTHTYRKRPNVRTITKIENGLEYVIEILSPEGDQIFSTFKIK